MEKDRKLICKIISEMLDSPGPCDIYPTGKAYDELEAYVELIRNEMLTWAYTEVCVLTETPPEFSIVRDLVAQAVSDGLLSPPKST